MHSSQYTMNYISKLQALGMKEDDAAVVVNDFLRDLDFEGLADYCAEMEKIHRDLEKVSK